MTSASRRQLCKYSLFLREVYFFRNKVSSRKKKTGILKSWLLHKVAANRLLIARDRLSQRVRDRSISQFVQRWASGSAISKIVRLRSFSLPEALYRGNAIYWQLPCLRWWKKNKRAYTHIRVYASPRDDTALIEFLDPRRSAWLFITRAIYLRVIPLLWRRRHTNRKREHNTSQKTVGDFYPLDKRHPILSIFSRLW